MIDTHCHLEKEDYDNIDEIIEKCIDVGVKKIIVSGHDLSSCKEALELTKKYDNVYATLGFLPDVVDEIDDSDLNLLEKMLNEDNVVGVGEIGLDYYYVDDNKEAQKKLFIKQLGFAKKYRLPVVIHSRDALNDTYEILKNEKINSGTMHCYSGSLEYAYKFIDLGLYISIGGVSTFKNAKEPKEVAAAIELENLMLETDCPYLAPHPFRGQENSPKFIGFVAKEIANLRNIPYDSVVLQTSLNAREFFNINR